MKILSLIPFNKLKSPRQVISQSWDDREKNISIGCKSVLLEKTENYFNFKLSVGIIKKRVTPDSVSLEIHEIDQNIVKARHKWDQNLSNQGNLFWNDISQLVKDFLFLARMQSGTIHLKVINDNACSKFHTDRYKLRLFTTYYGKGTQWLPEKATNRKALGKTNKLIVKDASKIQELSPYDVGVLKQHP